jgi:hypothetical protein
MDILGGLDSFSISHMFREVNTRANMFGAIGFWI